jgi:hypothetical protein
MGHEAGAATGGKAGAGTDAAAAASTVRAASLTGSPQALPLGLAVEAAQLFGAVGEQLDLGGARAAGEPFGREHRAREGGESVAAEAHRPAVLPAALHLGLRDQDVADDEALLRDGVARLGHDDADGRRPGDGDVGVVLQAGGRERDHLGRVCLVELGEQARSGGLVSHL